MQAEINLESHFFDNADVEAATQGYAHPQVLREWVKLGYFNTRMEPVLAGKSRKFPLPAVYEAVTLAHFARAGILLRYALEFNAQFIESIRKEGGYQAYLDTGIVAGDGYSRCFVWKTEQRQSDKEPQFLSNISLEDLLVTMGGNGGWVGEETPLPFQMAECLVIINLSGIIRNVNAILEKRLKEKKE
ncbi:MAG: hypothetical protein ACK52W_05345 [Alphaproteobacteria bacterium]